MKYARGGDDGAGQWWCLYRDEKAGAELKVTAYHFNDDYFATFYDQTKANPNGVDMFDGPPGVIRMVSLGEDGSADSILLDPDTKYYVNANLQYAETKRRKADRQASSRSSRRRTTRSRPARPLVEEVAQRPSRTRLRWPDRCGRCDVSRRRERDLLDQRQPKCDERGRPRGPAALVR